MADSSPDETAVTTEGPGDQSHPKEETEPLDKMESKQRLAADELIRTEASYVRTLQLCTSDIRGHLKQLPEGDLDILFSNMDDIVLVSLRLLRGLEAAAPGSSEQLSLISSLFLELREDIEGVYRTYCVNYDQALSLVEAYKKDAGLQQGIQEVLTAVVPQAGPSGLSFLLVMPVQRITKYPLLLQKILEYTSPEDRAFPGLQEATAALQEINANINEYKRRREVATKYNKAEHLTLRERFYRINTHSISKKTTRLSQMFKQEAGIVSRTEDKEFDDLEEKFHDVTLCVIELKENVASYLKNLEAFLSSKPHECDLEIEEGPVQHYHRLANNLHHLVFLEFKRRLESLVYRPLCHLTESLAGPRNLIRKRLDKLLDFERVEEKRAETGSVTYEEEATRHTYQALNSLLVSELPRFNQVAARWLGQILRTLMALQRDLAQRVLSEAEGKLAQLPHSQVPEATFRKLVQDSVDQASRRLQSFCQSFEAVMPSPTVQPLSPRTERQVQALVSKHGPDKLYQVTSNVSGSRELDLVLQRGQIVALLQDRDTKGHRDRWLVDSGGHRGYVPAGKLQPYHLVQTQTSKTQTLAPDEAGEKRRHSYTPLENPKAPIHFVEPIFQVVAAYPFAARSGHEVSLQAGQVVTVLEPHDKKGSPEWSLVEVSGQRGYVPSAFLVTVPVPEPWGWGSAALGGPAQ
ncbi:rho guanine nucleotide exchange factor 37 [Ornithorhynchus anatinus]|uniref:Rho guanine nucleotide exchange factor 37 n=1 Tax=Ornithorhynchus anatinus TaxID=9258 RepID=A0A6I8NWG4_ORNAN|nr:rho guanine nucleotide exchange factor 37 [Ornithorhynchus anatinus]